MTLTVTQDGQALTETVEGITMPADYSFATVNDYIHGIDVNFEELQALCLGMADHIDKLRRGEFICKRCGLRWDDLQWYPCRCPECGWQGMSNETAGGGAIADTGDYAEAVCPMCIAPGGDYEAGKWIPVDEIPPPNAELRGADPALSAERPSPALGCATAHNGE